MSIKEWKEISRELVFKKYSRAIEKVMFGLPDGSESDFYIKAESPAACILGITDQDEIITIRQFRPGPKMILNELPGGYVEPGEDAVTAIKREFLEETGYQAEVEFVGDCLDDAYSTMVRSCFVAKHCVKVAEPQNSQTEQTEVHLMKLADFRKLLRSGKMTDVEVGYLCLDYLNKL